MTAKLYRVRITELNDPHTQADVRTALVAATSPDQAKRRALKNYGLRTPSQRILVSAECWRGGLRHESFRRLKEPA